MGFCKRLAIKPPVWNEVKRGEIGFIGVKPISSVSLGGETKAFDFKGCFAPSSGLVTALAAELDEMWFERSAS